MSLIKLSGGTDVYEGLYEASNSWKSNGVDSARTILISDGNFSVSSKIVALVKKQYDEKGRRLTVVQIDSKAKGMEKLDPYKVTYHQIMPSELGDAIFQIYRPASSGMIACPCFEDYDDIMNYHFVIDYSGSMLSLIHI